MLKFYSKLRKMSLGIMLAMLCGHYAMAQTTISGTIIDASTKEPLIGVSVQVKNKVIGTITDIKGKFSLNTSSPLPLTLSISSIGYKGQEINVTAENTNLSISLEEQSILGQEIVVAGSRVEETVMRSPVAVEKMDIRSIRESTSPSFYDGMANLKGVDVTTQGLLFKSINMRGFGATGNPRTVQMIDGMDNQAPGLNFPVDNIVGMPELDVESVEVLPGAASALYGPNAINGLILMNSKSPFLYQGLSANIKSGIMNASNRATATTPFYDLSVRYAKAFNNKFAYKVNLSYIGAKDWEANDYTNLNVGGGQNGTRGAGVDTDYDGVNIYGDEVQADMRTVANGLVSAGLLPSAAVGLIPTGVNVSRTGFHEKDLVDYNTKSFKTNVALHYRINEKIEAIGQVNYGYGTTVYTGTGRYSLSKFNLTQVKLELKGDNFTIRGYTTQERSGESFFAGLQAVAMLNSIKPHATWFGEYVGAFAQARGAGMDEASAHLAARGFADKNMPAVESSAFTALRDKYAQASISSATDGGGGFLEKTNMYHAEGMYNFKNQVKFIDLIAGANIRRYQLRSNGTLFSDLKDGRDGVIPIDEYGAFAQASKSMFKDHFKLTASLRYDKNENFDGQFTPRVSGVATFGEQNFRLSYQSGFRIPTTQNQYIDLATPSGTLIGGLPEFDSRYKLSTGIPVYVLTDFSKNPTKYITDAVKAAAQQYATAAVTAQLPVIQQSVIAAVQAQVTAGVTAQVNAAVAAGQLPAANAPEAIAKGVAAQMGSDAIKTTIATQVTTVVTQQITAVTTQVVPAYALAALPKYQAKPLVPEKIQSYEIGYKGLIAKKLFVDAYYYFSRYRDFLGGISVVVPLAPAGPGLPIESGAGSASTRAGYSRTANTSEDITVAGWALSANYSLPKGFNVGGNIAFNQLKGFTPSPEQQYAGFNTPEYRYNLSFGKRLGSGDKVGFNINFRHQDSFLWESSFVQPTTTSNTSFTNTTVPAINNIDAQVSFKLPAMKSIIKVGGTNIGGKPYVQAYGSASVGSMYYVSLSFDELLNR